MQKLNLIWAHPRTDSLTAQVVTSLKDVAESKGYNVNETDLYRLDFDPVLREVDEPDWSNPNKQYSEAVELYSSQLSPDDTMVVVFPVWWYSFPAILKGYIDRVWNFGHIYGVGSRVPAKKIVWVALVGDTEQGFAKRKHNEFMEKFLNSSIAGYCGTKDSQVVFLYNTLATDIEDISAHYESLFKQAKEALSKEL